MSNFIRVTRLCSDHPFRRDVLINVDEIASATEDHQGYISLRMKAAATYDEWRIDGTINHLEAKIANALSEKP